MPDSTVATSAAPADPAWLAPAIEAYEQEKLNDGARTISRRQQLVRNINDRLAARQIVPLQPAHLDERHNLRGAVLLEADYDEGTYEVRALWDENSQQIELHTADWEDHNPSFGRVRLMNTVGDIIAARHETPKVPVPQRNFKNEALRAIDSLNVDRLDNYKVEAITTAINGLTAAVLHVGDLIARSADRP
ncbi:hypothetical protein AB0J01_27715 [Streptomyces sp. NPDC050204]|uniref:hypothetical protein n=1 Tax=Streptomyces sp. NPDC050204 TaxID=3155514 RepID=UPI00344036DC